jgi:hypothetical protein
MRDSSVKLSIDHVAVAVPDLDRASRALEMKSGHAATARIEQTAWGTDAVIMPLQHGFLELIAVQCAKTAAQSMIGRRVAAVATRGGGVVAWAVAPEGIEAFALSRGLLLQPGGRPVEAGGSAAYSWHMAGLVNAFFTDTPLLIRWDSTPANPYTVAALSAGRTLHGRFSAIDIDGEPAALDGWLGDVPRDFAVRRTQAGSPRLAVIAGADGAEIFVP